MNLATSGRHLFQVMLLIAVTVITFSARAQQGDAIYFQLGDEQPVAGLAPGMSVTDLGAVTRIAQVSMSNGDELMSGLLKYVESEKPAAGRMTGIGGFESAVFAWYDPEQGAFKRIPIDDKSEVVSFTGSVSWQNGVASVHVHAVVSLGDGTTRGGHVVSAQISPIMQIFVFETEG